jgi:hypothetical protein
MLRRAIPLLAASLLAASTAVQAADPSTSGASTATQAPDHANTLQRAKARKTATADPQRSDRASKPVSDRSTAPTATPTATRPTTPSDTESFHDCHSASGGDA